MSPGTLTRAHRDAIGAVLADAALSPHTRRSYAGAWRRFAEWCERRGAPTLPAATPNPPPRYTVAGSRWPRSDLAMKWTQG